MDNFETHNLITLSALDKKIEECSAKVSHVIFFPVKCKLLY